MKREIERWMRDPDNGIVAILPYAVITIMAISNLEILVRLTSGQPANVLPNSTEQALLQSSNPLK
jgi:hypothetical protein